MKKVGQRFISTFVWYVLFLCVCCFSIRRISHSTHSSIYTYEMAWKLNHTHPFCIKWWLWGEGEKIIIVIAMTRTRNSIILLSFCLCCVCVYVRPARISTVWKKFNGHRSFPIKSEDTISEWYKFDQNSYSFRSRNDQIFLQKFRPKAFFEVFFKLSHLRNSLQWRQIHQILTIFELNSKNTSKYSHQKTLNWSYALFIGELNCWWWFYRLSENSSSFQFFEIF